MPGLRDAQEPRLCLYFYRQLIQSAGFVRGNHVPPATPGGHTKHFFRMANRNISEPMTAAQVLRAGRIATPVSVCCERLIRLHCWECSSKLDRTRLASLAAVFIMILAVILHRVTQANKTTCRFRDVELANRPRSRRRAWQLATTLDVKNETYRF